MPLPQAHLYCVDPLHEDAWLEQPTRMYKVDFAFCTGQRLVAVEIDGSSHVGSPGHVWKDRHLMRAGVHVVHILNAELVQHGTRAVTELLPNDVLSFWRDVKEIRVFDLPGFVWPLAPR